MREIKFRAWDRKQKIMIRPNGIEFLVGGEKVFSIASGDGWARLNKKFDNLEQSFDLMQYTGLFDSSATEFCEGDILEYDGEYWKVEFYYGAFWIVAIGGTAVAELLMDNDYMDVVGNIYENKHLIELKKNPIF